MLIKMFFCEKTATLAEYRRKTEAGRLLDVVLIVLGVFTVAFGLIATPRLLNGGAPAWLQAMMTSSNNPHSADFFSGVYTGLGSVLVVFGVLGLVRTARLLKDEAALKAERTKQEDEREQAIALQTGRTATLITLVLLYVALVVSAVFNPQLFDFCFVSVMVYCLIIFVCKAYYSRKM